MSQLSVSVNFLAANSNTPLLAPEGNKEAPQDGFQALLDIGNDVPPKAPATARSLQQEDILSDNDFASLKDTKEISDKPQVAERKEAVRDVARPVGKKEEANDKSDKAENAAPVRTKQNDGDQAEKEAKVEAKETDTVDNSAPAILPVEEPPVSQSAVALREAIFGLLAQLTGTAVTDGKSVQAALDLLAQGKSSGQALAPERFLELQSLVQNLRLLSAAQTQELELVSGLEFSGLLARLNLLSGQEAAKNNLFLKAGDTNGPANSAAQKIETVDSIFLEANDNAAEGKPALSSLLAKMSPAASQEETATVNKSTPASTVAANVQAAAKVEAAAAKSNGFDTGTGQKEGNGFAALPRTAPAESAQTNSPAFSRVLQQQARPVIDQIVFHIKTSPLTGNSRIHIQLHPAELGKIEIKMDVADTDGKTSLTVTADNKNTLDLLQRDRSGLERALADAGLKADTGDLNFNLRGEQQQGKEPDSFKGSLPYAKAPQEEPLPLEDILAGPQTINLALGLDIKI